MVPARGSVPSSRKPRTLGRMAAGASSKSRASKMAARGLRTSKCRRKRQKCRARGSSKQLCLDAEFRFRNGEQLKLATKISSSSKGAASQLLWWTSQCAAARCPNSGPMSAWDRCSGRQFRLQKRSAGPDTADIESVRIAAPCSSSSRANCGEPASTPAIDRPSGRASSTASGPHSRAVSPSRAKVPRNAAAQSRALQAEASSSSRIAASTCSSSSISSSSSSSSESFLSAAISARTSAAPTAATAPTATSSLSFTTSATLMSTRTVLSAMCSSPGRRKPTAESSLFTSSGILRKPLRLK
mmetsp:Transcript_119492/g.381279  ORF Transcript_119492/g.381279 Transcript_119492/m.381279 type:complete len:300 (-) Transcript_119492:2146-3045(-)